MSRSTGPTPRKQPWLLQNRPAVLLASWIVLIAASCTDAVGNWANGTFNALYHAFAPHLALIRSPSAHFVAEKSVHFFLYIGVSLILSQVFRGQRRRFWYVLAAGSVLGCCSELLQFAFPTRDPALRDVGINATGVLLGVLLTALWDWTRATVPISCLGAHDDRISPSLQDAA